MSRLSKYEFKHVKVVDVNGKIYTGYVDVYTQPNDNEEGEESIGLMPSEHARVGWELFDSEIVSIEEI